MTEASDLVRGHTDTIILARLFKADSYGYQINKEILSTTENRFELKEATLYTAFRRLEQSGYIRSYWGDENSGARRKYYSITQAGRILYQENCQQWDAVKEIIDKLIHQNLNEKGENSNE